MAGSSAAKSYGSLGSSCAMRPPRGARLHSTPKNAIVLLNRQHPVESDLRPVLLIVGDRNAVMHAAFDQLFKNPEQVVWRHAKHLRAQAPKLTGRTNTPIRCYFLREAIDEVHLGADGPFGSCRAVLHCLDDVFGASTVVSRLHDVPRHFRMDDDTDARVLAPHARDLPGTEADVHRAVALPKNHPRAVERVGINAAEDFVRIPDDHLVKRNPHLVRGVAPKVLIREKQDFVP